jgi:heat shock protein HslJ
MRIPYEMSPPSMFEHRVVPGRVLPLVAGLIVAVGVLPQLSFAQVPVQVPPPSSSSSAPNSLTQGIWQWERTEYSDDSVVTANDPSRYTITFLPAGQLAIRADCNNVTGTYTASASQLSIQLGATTLVACPPDSQDSLFLRDLGNTVTYVFDGNQLVLNLKFDTGNMIFSPLPAASLTGSPWDVQSYNNGRGGVVTVLQGTHLTATFGDDGHISGSAGCNTYMGSYSVTGSNISIGPLASTRMACTPDDVNTQEQAFLMALEASTTYELVGDRLTLRDGGGATQVVMVKPAG